MSKQHHFVVYRDDETKTWWIEPDGIVTADQTIYDTASEEWSGVHSRADMDEDGEALDDLTRRLA